MPVSAPRRADSAQVSKRYEPYDADRGLSEHASRAADDADLVAMRRSAASHRFLGCTGTDRERGGG
jgi:hypothetical protein